MAPQPGPASALVVSVALAIGCMVRMTRETGAIGPLVFVPQADSASTQGELSSDERRWTLSRWGAAVPHRIEEAVAKEPYLRQVLLVHCCILCGAALWYCFRCMMYLSRKLRGGPRGTQASKGFESPKSKSKVRLSEGMTRSELMKRRRGHSHEALSPDTTESEASLELAAVMLESTAAPAALKAELPTEDADGTGGAEPAIRKDDDAEASEMLIGKAGNAFPTQQVEAAHEVRGGAREEAAAELESAMLISGEDPVHSLSLLSIETDMIEEPPAVVEVADAQTCAEPAGQSQLTEVQAGEVADDCRLLGGADAGAGDTVTCNAKVIADVSQEEAVHAKPPRQKSPNSGRRGSHASIHPRGVDEWLHRHHLGHCKRDATEVEPATALDTTPNKQTASGVRKAPASNTVTCSSEPPKALAHTPVGRCPSPARRPCAIPPRGVELWLQRHRSPGSTGSDPSKDKQAEAAIRRSPTPSRNSSFVAHSPLPKRRLSM